MRGWVATFVVLAACGGGTAAAGADVIPPAEGETARSSSSGDDGTVRASSTGSDARATGAGSEGTTRDGGSSGGSGDGAHPVLAAYAHALASFEGCDVGALDVDLDRTAGVDSGTLSATLSYCLFREVGAAALAATRDDEAREHARSIALLPPDFVAGREAGENAHTRLEALSSTVSIERVRCGRDRGARKRRCEARVERLASGVAVAWHLFFDVDATALADDDALVDAEAAERAGLAHPIPTLLTQAVAAGLPRSRLRRSFTECLGAAAEQARLL